MRGAQDDRERWLAQRLEAVGLAWPGAPAPPADAVVGVDGSRRALAAVAWAATLAERLHLVSAIGLYLVPSPGVTERSETTGEWMAADARGALARAREAVPGRVADERIAREPPAHALAGRAKETGSGLVAIGHGGKGALARAVLGSTGESLVRRAEVPVCVAHAPPGDGAIVAAIGDDAGSATALAWADFAARRLDRPLVALHAAPQGPHGFAGDAHGLKARLLHGAPHDAVAAALRALRPALLVIGQGHHAGLGGTALRILRKAPCTTVVTPAL